MMKLPGRYREHLKRMLRSYWLVVVVTVAVGAITWRFCPPQPRLTFQNSEGWVPVGFSPNGSIFAAYTLRGHDLALWDAQTGEELERLALPDVEKEKTTFSQEGDLVLFDHGRIRLRTVPFGTEKETEIRGIWPSSRPVFSANGQRLAVDCTHVLQVWDWPKQQLLATFPSAKTFSHSGYSLSPDGATLAVPTLTGFQFWDVATASKGPGSQPVAEIDLTSNGLGWNHEMAPNHKVCVTSDRDLGILSSSVGGIIRMWRIRGTPGEGLSVVPYGEIARDGYPDQNISPDSKMIAISTVHGLSPGSFWNRVKGFLPWLNIDPATAEAVILDLDTGERAATIPNCFAGRFSADSRSFAALAHDDMIHLWDIPPRKPMGIVLTAAAVAGIMTWLVRRWFLRARRLRAT
jgi:WD40 repeat protein